MKAIPAEAMRALIARVLVVDDVATMREFIRTMLSGLGPVEMRGCRDGEEAMETLGKPGGLPPVFRPSLVITDLKMPRANGLQLLRAIRSGGTAAPRALPCLAVTAISDERALASCMALDCDGILAKPVSRDQLLHRIARLAGALPHRTIASPRSYGVVPASLGPPAAEPPRPGDAAPAPAREVAVGQLAPGTILASDLLTPNATLLLRAGTVLSASLLDRLSDLAEFGLIPDRLQVAPAT